MVCLNNTANSSEFSKTLNFGSKSANLMMSSMILSSYCKDNNITSQEGIDGVSSNQLAIYWFNANKFTTQAIKDAFLAHTKKNYYVTKIISGGQTGVDTIGLEEALNILAGENKSGTDKKVSITSEGYRKEDPWLHPDTNYVFTENAEAAEEVWRLANGAESEYKKEFPFKGTPKLNVSDMNGSNQAGIRTNSKGEITPTAYGIIVKKYQHDEKGRFVAKEGQFKDTESDFNMFKLLNERVFDKLDNSPNSKIKFPSQMALGKAALPLRFAMWLQKELKNRYGIQSDVQKNKRSDYDGYGLSIYKTINAESSNDNNTSKNSNNNITVGSVINQGTSTDTVTEETLVKNTTGTEEKAEIKNEEPEKLATDNEEFKAPSEIGDAEILNENLKKDSTLMKQCNIDIPASIRADRVKLVADLFSTGLDIRVQQVIENLDKQIKEEKDDLVKSALVRIKNEAGKDRLSLLKKGDNDSSGYITIQECFNEGYQILENYLNSSRDELIELEKNEYGIDDKQAGILVDRKLEAFPKIEKYYKILAREASGIIYYNTGVKIDINLGGKELIDTEDNSKPEDSTNNNVEDESDAKDEQTKEGWNIQWNELNPYYTLSVRVRQMLGNLPILDSEGYADTDDLGNTRTIDPGMAHTLLIDRMKNINDAEDMMKVLRGMVNSKPWAQRIIDLIEGNEEEGMSPDPQLKNLIYHDLSKEYTKAFVLRQEDEANGAVSFNMIPVNSNVIGSAVLDEAKDNINNGITLDKNSVYNKDRSVNIDRIKKLSDTMTLLDNIDRTDNNTQFIEVLTNCLRSLGFNMNVTSMEKLLEDNPEVYDNIKAAVNNIAAYADNYTEAAKSNPSIPLYTVFATRYKEIANQLSATLEKEVPSMYRENDKTLSSYTPKSFLGKTINHLSNGFGDNEEKYDEWVNNHYLKFGWFNNNGVILNKWLKNLMQGDIDELPEIKSGYHGSTAQQMRKQLEFCTLHNIGGLKYEQWDDLNTLLSVYNMYKGGDNLHKSKESNNFAWYVIPTLSDSFTAQFVKFKKYKAGAKYSLGDYEDMVLSDFADVVTQEVNRITLVNKRDSEGIEPMQHFDRKASKDGIGGAKFFFIPELNDIKIDGKSFYDKYMELASTDADSLRKTVIDTLEGVFQKKFESFMDSAERAGMLALSADGKFKYIKGARPGDYSKELISRLSNLKKAERTEESSSKIASLEKEINERTKHLAAEEMREFFYNHTLAQAEIIQLMTVDLAFYKNTNDFIKRWKEVYSSMLRLNTEAEYRHKDGVIEKVGRKYETSLYLKDVIERSTLKKDINDVLDIKVEKHQITEDEKERILDLFDKINITDGQAFRTIDSYRTVRIMAGTDWTDEMEDAYQAMISGSWNIKQFDVIWQIIKPFTYSLMDGKADNDGNRMPVPVQHKDSEALLLYQLVAHLPGQKVLSNPVLEGLSEFMKIGYHDGNNHGVDVAVFESGVKVGMQGAIDIYHRPLTEEEKKKYGVKSTQELLEKLDDAIIKNTRKEGSGKIKGIVIDEDTYNSIVDSVRFKNKDDVVNHLKEITGVNEDENGHYSEAPHTEDYIHKVEYEDYGTQVETPPHMFDAQQMIGTQINKLCFSDIPSETRLTIGGKQLTKDQFMKLYDAMNVSGRLEGLYGLIDDMYPDGNFNDKSGVSRLILQSMSGDNKYSYDMLRAAMTDSEGKFLLPPYEALHTVQIQNICFSLLRSRVIKQKTAGGSAIQTSCVGNENLHVKFSNDPITGKKRVEYVECLMPFYLKDKMEDFKDENGNIDISRIDPEMLKVIGYRIPTEDKYSMLPLKIIGFLPQQGGTMVIMPKDITLITGSDFDVDKMFLIFPERSERGEGMSYRDFVNNLVRSTSDEIYERASSELKASERFSHEDSLFREAYKMALDMVQSKQIPSEDLMKAVDMAYRKLVTDVEKEDADAYIQRKQEYVSELKKRIGIIKNELKNKLYDTDSPDYKQYHDMYEKQLSEGELSPKRLSKLGYELPFDNNGNIDTEKVLALSKAQKNNIIHDLMWESLTSSQAAEKFVSPQNFDEPKRAAKILRILMHGGKYTLKSFEKMSNRQIDDIASKLSETLDILSPSAYMYYHSQNTVGKQMIAIYASHAVCHALCQKISIGINDEYGFVFGDHEKPLLSLSRMTDDKGRLISKTLASLIGAAADTAKDPFLADLFQNERTANITCFLIRLGYSPLEVGLLFAQPEVQEVLDMLYKDQYMRMDDAIHKVSGSYKSEDTDTLDTQPHMNETKFSNEFLASRIGKTSGDGYSYDILQLFSTIADRADDVRSLNSAIRFDTTKGSIGATEGDIFSANTKVMKQLALFKPNPFSEMPPIFYGGPLVSGTAPSITGNREKDIRESFEEYMNSNLPLIESSYGGTVGSVKNIFKDMFMVSTPVFEYALEQLSQYTRNGMLRAETVNNARSALQKFLLTQTSVFGAEEGLTNEEKRQWYITRFPGVFSRFKQSGKYHGEFFNELTVDRDRSTGEPSIQFKNVGRLSYERRDNMMRDWVMMLENGDKEVSDMAKKLFVYGIMKYGMRFSPSGFVHLASVDILNAVPDYSSTIESIGKIINTDVIKDSIGSFIIQYVKNNPYSEMTRKVDSSELPETAVADGKILDKFQTPVVIGNGKLICTKIKGESILLMRTKYDKDTKLYTYERLPILHNEYDGSLSESNSFNMNTIYNAKDYEMLKNSDGFVPENTDIETFGPLDDHGNSIDKINERINSEMGGYVSVDTFSPSDLEAGGITFKDINDPDNVFIRELSIGDNSKQKHNKDLVEALKNMLKSYGISVGSLTSLEEELGMNGVTNFNLAETEADGIVSVIRLAKGIRGDKALPEEFAHWAYRVMLDRGDRFAERLLQHMIDNHLAADILGDKYDKYYEFYKGDEKALAEEAAGHLIADELCKRYQKKGIINTIRNLFDRLIYSLKKFFASKDEKVIIKAMYYARQGYGKIALGILDNTYDSQFKQGLSYRDFDEKLYSITKKTSRLEDIANNILERELKYLHIQRGKNTKDRDEQAELNELINKEEGLITRMKTRILAGEVKEGLVETLKDSLETVKDLKDQLDTLGSKTSYSITYRAIRLRNMKNRIYSYSKTIAELRQFVNTDKTDPAFNSQLKEALDQIASLFADVDSIWKEQALHIFAEYLRPYFGEKVQITVGKNKGKVYNNPEQLLREADSDIKQIDLWLESMSASGDYILRAVDSAVKMSKGRKRVRVTEYSKRIKALGMELRNSGIKNFDFMYERGKDGKLTGNYISESQSMFLPPVKKKFYDSYIAIYDELKALIPQKFNDMNGIRRAVQIRKDLMERMLSSDSLKTGVQQLFANATGEIIRKEDDDTFGVKFGIQDFEGKEYNMVPVYYMGRLKNADLELSTDAVSTLIAFADTAVNFDEISNISDILEIGKEVLKERTTYEKEGGKQKMGVFSEMSRKITNKMNAQSSNALAKYQSFLETQIYGKYMKDEGGVHIEGLDVTVDTAKFVNMANRANSTFVLAGNILSGFASMLSDITMINSEAVAGQFFSMRQLLKADKIYGSELMKTVSDIGNRSKTGKLNLFIELFDLMRDNKARDEQFDKGRIKRFISMDTLYFAQHAGDHWGNCRTAIAMALHDKVKDASGKEIPLWDALEVEYLDNNNHSKGARLKIKEGVKTLDGKTFGIDEITKFSNKCRGLSNYLFGIYNNYDAAVMQRYTIGRLAMSFRKYLVPAYERRFMKANYNMDLDTEMEGYYTTAWRFLGNIIRDSKKGKLTVLTTWKNMSQLERQNMARATTELATCLLLSVACMMMNKAVGDDLSKRPWLLRTIAYYMNRLRYEVSVLTPSLGMMNDSIQLVKNPFPIAATLQSVTNLSNIFYPSSWVGDNSTIQQGFMKGYPKGLKDLVDSPFTPRIQTMWKGLHPEHYMNMYR